MWPVNSPRAATAVSVLVALGFAAIPASAGDWKLSDRFRTSLSLSDNIDRTADGETGLILDVTPGLTLTGSGARVRAAVSVAPTFSQQLGGNGDSRLSLGLNGNVNAEVYENVVFLDARASAGLASISGRSNVGLGPSVGIGNDDITQYFTLSGGAEVRNRFGRYADTRLRLNLDGVSYTDGSLDSSTSGTLSYVINSGSYFPIVPWTVSFYTNQTGFEDRDDSRTSVDGQVRYRVDTHWLARANVGWEKNDVETDRDETDGVFWSVGGLWTPNPRTNLDVRYGQRYFGPDWNLSFSHGTRRTTITASASRSVTNQRAERLGNAFTPFVAVGPRAADAPPSLDPNPDLPGITDEDYLLTGARVGIALAGRRTSASTYVSWSQRDYEVSNVVEDTYTFGINASRRLFGDYRARAGVTWQRTESEFDEDSESYDLTIGASRSLGRRSSIGLDFSHYKDEYETRPSITENRVTATFSTSFL